MIDFTIQHPEVKNRHRKYTAMVGLLIMMVALIGPIVASHARPGIAALSYSLLAAALEIANGQGLGSNYQWPLGYSLLVAGAEVLGLDPLTAGSSISLFAFGLAAVCVFLLASRLTGSAGAIIAGTLFVSNIVLLRWAVMIMTEMPFLFSLTLAALVFDKYIMSASDSMYGPRWYLVAFGIGLALALPFWFRYIGIIVPLAILPYIFYMGWKDSIRRAESAIIIVTSMLVLIFLPIRNLLFIGTLTWHQQGNTTPEPFMTALFAMNQEFWVTLSTAFPVAVGRSLTMIILIPAFVLGLLAARKSPRLYPVVLAVPVYIVLFTVAYSRAVIDPVSERYIVPILPFVFITIAIAGKYLIRILQQRRRTTSIARMTGVGLIGIIILKASIFVIEGYQPTDASYSPKTLQLMRETVPDGSVIYGNRWAIQVAAMSTKYHFVYIPWETTHYAFEIKPWSREEMLNNLVKDHVRYIVFCMGPDRRETFLESEAYGHYVGSLVRNGGPEVKRVMNSTDGMILELVDEATLRTMLAKTTESS